jgi:hypothetical protein
LEKNRQMLKLCFLFFVFIFPYSFSGTYSAPLDQLLWLQACALNLWNPKQAAKNNGPPTVHPQPPRENLLAAESVHSQRPGGILLAVAGSFGLVTPNPFGSWFFLIKFYGDPTPKTTDGFGALTPIFRGNWWIFWGFGIRLSNFWEPRPYRYNVFRGKLIQIHVSYLFHSWLYWLH